MIIGLGAGMRRPDSMIKLHMPFDGEASVFRDRSGKGIASYQGTNSPVQSISQRKFIGKSMWCNQYGSGFDTDCYYADNDDWFLDTNAFTIKFWAYFTSLPATNKLHRHTGQTNSSGNFPIFIGIYNLNGNMNFTLGMFNTALYWYQAYAFQTNKWYFIMVHRDASGNMRMFVNGVQVGSSKSVPSSLGNYTGGWVIGASNQYSGGGLGLWGYVDEYTFIKGRGEWPRGLGQFPEASPLSRRY